MKTFVESYKKLIKEIDDAINDAVAKGLPLDKIELTHEEWDDFVIARTTLSNGKRLDVAGGLLVGSTMYLRTNIYRGPPTNMMKPDFNKKAVL